MSFLHLSHPSRLKVCLSIAFLVMHISLCQAANLYGNASDCSIRSDVAFTDVGSTSLLQGGSGSPAQDRTCVFVFQLPDLGAVADPFTNASFRFNVASVTGAPPNIDLYGLGSRTNAAVLTSDYYGETTTVDPTDATYLQNNILTSSSSASLVTTNTAGSTALKSYLNAQYASGAGIGKHVFLRLSSDTAPGGVARYALTSAEGGASGPPDTRPQIIYNVPVTSYARPFIWVRDSEKAGILAKIAANPWATSVRDGIVSRVATDLASHQSGRDTWLRQLPIDWTLTTPKFKTIPTYDEGIVRGPTEAKYNDAQDCALLYYLTGNTAYAQCAADVLHNATKALNATTASTGTNNGGWLYEDDLLKESRIMGCQLPIIFDFLHTWLQSNQVYDVKTASMVNFNFTTAQAVFRKYYQLVRDHGNTETNWSALEATCMLNNLLALTDATEREAALQIYLTTGGIRQASLDYDYRHYTSPGDIWPESLQYASAVGSIRSSHMVLLERIDPALTLFDQYPNLPTSTLRIPYLRYPNGQQISFGDGHRETDGEPYHRYEQIYQHAKARGRTALAAQFGARIASGVADGSYNRSTVDPYDSLSMHDQPLQLLWFADTITETAVPLTLPRTDTLPFAGVALQRNPAPANNATYGLMGFIGGAGFIHSHASGMSMELFGMGQVMGAKAGRDDYQSDTHEKYYRLFAANNTVIVNGASVGDGGWSDIEINTVQTVAMEPQPFAAAISPSYSFTTSTFADNRGTLAEGTQHRTLAIIRTSPTTGYYFDLFRSRSTVTNRTATTLNGTVTNQYHDYIYRNIGETTVDLRADGVTLPLVSQPTRFQNDVGYTYQQPGWRYFTNTVVSYPTSQSIRAQFFATVSGTARYMDMHMPAVASREYAKVDSPPIVDAPSPYHTRVAPTLVIRQIGEAWNKAFAAVYEPHFGLTGGTVQNVTQLVKSGVVVGVKVGSSVLGRNLVQYILCFPTSSDTYTDAGAGLSFTGRFGVASYNGDGTTTLYLGEGSAMSYRGNSIGTVSTSNTQAEVRFSPSLAPVIATNTPLNVTAAPPGTSWLPTAGGTDYAWTESTNWNPAFSPNGIGTTAAMITDIFGDQTVAMNDPITLSEYFVGDSSGAQNTLLQKGTNGSLTFDKENTGMTYLTRTAGGSGTVTFKDDLNIALNDHLTVRTAGGTTGSTMVIAGPVSGPGMDLTKESSTLALTLSASNSYSGITRISGGVLSLDHSLAMQNSVLDTLNSVVGDASNGLRTSMTTLTLGGLTGDKSLASVFTTNAGGFSGLTALTLNPTTNATYSGIIADGAAGMTLSKTGSGTQTLSGLNTYTGATSILNGTLEIGGAGTLASTSVSIGSAATFAYNSTAAQTLSSLSGSGAITKGTSGNLTLSAANTAFTGSVSINAGTLSLGHLNALSAATAITLGSSTTLTPVAGIQNVIIHAPITLTGNTTLQAPDFGSGSTTSTLTVGGAISGPAGVTFRSNGTVASNSQQTILLNAQSTYSGSTTLHPNGSNANLIVRLGVTNALPTTTVLAINGSAGGGSGRFARLELNGFSQTIAGLQNTAANLRNQQIRSATAATLTVNNDTNYSYSGSIETNIALTKAGAGTLTLTGVTNYTGHTTVNGGVLALANVNANNDASNINLATSGAQLQLNFTGTDTIARFFTGPIQRPAGTYGHSSTGATNGGLGVGAMDAYFLTGTGTLNVTTSPPANFAAWSTGTFGGGAVIPANLRGPNDDPDGDGLSNLLEYALAGTDPTLNNTLAGTLNGRTLTYTKRPGANGLTYSIQQSSDLITWIEVSGATYINNATTISFTQPPGLLLKYFLRLQVLSN
jgi:autotransporter-associated beta strand protein